jgi:membrane-associated protein
VLFDLADVLDHVTGALGPWTYAIVGALVFMETVAFVGLLAPGEVTLAIGGAAAANGDVALLPLLALVWVAGVLGDLTGYALGRRYGWSLLRKAGPRVGLTAPRQRRLAAALARSGGKALVIGRFVGLVRVFAPFAAGTSGMPTRRLVRLSIVGVGLWGPTLVLATYAFADTMGKYLQAAGNVALSVLAAVAVVYGLRRRRAPAIAR